MQYSLITPQELFKQIPQSFDVHQQINSFRDSIQNIIQKRDKRLLVVVGPCSIHDPVSALEYAALLKKESARFEEELVIVMRAYLEKPRTTLGWKGFIHDPFLNNSGDINSGLTLARKLLVDIANINLPCATEFVDTITANYFHDLISWGTIGARTAESQIHREFVSSVNIPFGFKNNTDGNVKIAVDAVKVALNSHYFIQLDNDARLIRMLTEGNTYCHVVLRGSNTHPNYEPHHIKHTQLLLDQAGLTTGIMVDCSHGNSNRNYLRQINVVNSIIQQLNAGSKEIIGVMLESNLVAGKQIVFKDQPLIYGQSITDECLSWQETKILLEKLAHAIKMRNMSKSLEYQY